MRFPGHNSLWFTSTTGKHHCGSIAACHYSPRLLLLCAGSSHRVIYPIDRPPKKLTEYPMKFINIKFIIISMLICPHSGAFASKRTFDEATRTDDPASTDTVTKTKTQQRPKKFIDRFVAAAGDGKNELLEILLDK